MGTASSQSFRDPWEEWDGGFYPLKTPMGKPCIQYDGTEQELDLVAVLRAGVSWWDQCPQKRNTDPTSFLLLSLEQGKAKGRCKTVAITGKPVREPLLGTGSISTFISGLDICIYCLSYWSVAFFKQQYKQTSTCIIAFNSLYDDRIPSLRLQLCRIFSSMHGSHWA